MLWFLILILLTTCMGVDVRFTGFVQHWQALTFVLLIVHLIFRAFKKAVGKGQLVISTYNVLSLHIFCMCIKVESIHFVYPQLAQLQVAAAVMLLYACYMYRSSNSSFQIWLYVLLLTLWVVRSLFSPPQITFPMCLMVAAVSICCFSELIQCDVKTQLRTLAITYECVAMLLNATNSDSIFNRQSAVIYKLLLVVASHMSLVAVGISPFLFRLTSQQRKLLTFSSVVASLMLLYYIFIVSERLPVY